jgi:membrane fusion protein (multidrug efflux system)
MSDDDQRDTAENGDQIAPENRGHAAAPDPEAAADDGDEDKKTSLFRKPKFWIIFIIVVAVIAVGAVLYWLHSRQYESTDDAFIDAHIVRLAPQVSGTLIQVAQVDNRHVEPGRLLAVIRPTTPQAQLAEAQANVQQAISQEKQAEAQVTAAIAARDQAAAQARAPIAEAAKAAQDLARYQELARIDRNAVAGQQLDQARAQARSTAAQAAAARQQIDNAAAQIAVARKQVAAAEAMITARQAQAKQAQVNLGDYRITAPVAGQVVNRSVNLGSYVAPGMNLMAIVPDRMWVTANFKETQLTEMRIGQPVSIKVDAFPDVEFKGHVDSIQRGAGQAFSILPAQNATGNYVKVVQRVPVRIEFDTRNGPDPRKYPIGPGMSVVPTVKVR